MADFDFNEWLKKEQSKVDTQVKKNEQKVAIAKGEFKFEPMETLKPEILYLNSNTLGKYRLSFVFPETGIRFVPNLRKIKIPKDVAKELNLRSSVKTTNPECYKDASLKDTVNRFNSLFDDFIKEIPNNIARGFVHNSFGTVDQYGRLSYFTKVSMWYLFTAKVLDRPESAKVLGQDEPLKIGGVYTFATKSSGFIKAYQDWMEGLGDAGIDPRNVLGRDVKVRPNYVTVNFSKGQPNYIFSISTAVFKDAENSEKFKITDEELSVVNNLEHHIVDINPSDVDRVKNDLEGWISYMVNVKSNTAL